MQATVYIPDAELQQFLSKLKDASEEVKKKAAFELTATALDIDKNAKGYCPVKTGRLKSSIKHRKLTQDGLNHLISTNVVYAPFVEKGTSKQRPQPFLRPAYLLGVNRFYARMRNLIP